MSCMCIVIIWGYTCTCIYDMYQGDGEDIYGSCWTINLLLRNISIAVLVTDSYHVIHKMYRYFLFIVFFKMLQMQRVEVDLDIFFPLCNALICTDVCKHIFAQYCTHPIKKIPDFLNLVFHLFSLLGVCEQSLMYQESSIKLSSPIEMEVCGMILKVKNSTKLLFLMTELQRIK